ncbi:hypothetical protein C8Q78DRAFT_550898 [Trametes maxima]|nr:hypothetical protein C8Q78DRAFT_550898 [Trametes maxima]
MNIGRLDEWNAKASRMQPYSAFSSHADVEDGPEANSNTSTADFRDTATPRGFSTLPVDLLGLIARHVYPKDVISLARVDKRARRYLMSRDNRVVWQDVLQKMHEGPKCPPFMSEPHYVALLFGRDCMGCGSAPGTFVALGWRLCQSCKIRNLILDSEVKDRFRKVLYFRRLHEHPVFYSTDPKRRAFHPSDILPHCVLRERPSGSSTEPAGLFNHGSLIYMHPQLYQG